MKKLLAIGLLLMLGVTIMPSMAKGNTIDKDNSIEYSRETETCINLRGCGRRDRT